MSRQPTADRLTIILPTYMEKANIAEMLGTLTSLYPGVRIIVADDNSTDGTAEDVEAIALANPCVSIIRRNPGDRGLTASVMEGIENASTEFFVVMDADFQHPPAAVKKILDKLGENDLVVGVRYSKMPLKSIRRHASGGAQTLASIYLMSCRQPRTHDNMSGFFGGRTELFQEIIHQNGHKFERPGFKVLFDFLKFMPRNARIDEIRFDFGERKGGESKLNSRIILSVLRQCGILGRGLATILEVFCTSHAGRVAGLFILALLAVLLFL